MLRFVFCFFSGLQLLTTGIFGIEKILNVSSFDQTPLSMTEHFTTLEDSSLSLTIEDVQKPEIELQFKGEHAPTEALNFGYTQSAYWFHVRLRNRSFGFFKKW